MLALPPGVEHSYEHLLGVREDASRAQLSLHYLQAGKRGLLHLW